ncbi:MAG: ATP-grasp domain-containing protein [Polyangiaceae bacterium]
MPSLLLIPPRLLASVSRQSWTELVREPAVLFTSEGTEEHRARTLGELSDVFRSIHFFDDLGTNDRVELEAIRLHEESPFTRVVATGEDDLLRAARLRELFGVAGPTSADVLVFRDKLLMKRRATAAGIPVARHAEVQTMTDVVAFVREVGYPIVVKPLRGMGSADTRVVRSDAELAAFADRRPFGRNLGLPHLLAEKFVAGALCHVNGLILGGRLQVVSPSRFIHTALEYVRDQSFLGSYVMGAGNPDRERLAAFATRVLLEAFPTPGECIFHMECFLKDDGEIVLCEVACRLGGNGINEEVRLSYDVDMKLEWLRSQLLGLGACNVRTAPEGLGSRLAGRLLISPREGRLEAIPAACAESFVLDYRTRGRPGCDYHPMNMSDDELASFLLVGPDEAELRTRILGLHEWFDKNTRWAARPAE